MPGGALKSPESWRQGYWKQIPVAPLTLRKLRAWVKQEPANPVARSYLGRFYARRGHHEDACVEWRKAIRLWRGESSDAIGGLWSIIAESRLALGQGAAARRAFGFAARNFRNAVVTTRLPLAAAELRMQGARCHLVRGEFAPGHALIRSVLSGPYGWDYAETAAQLSEQHPPVVRGKVRRPSLPRCVGGR